MFETLRTHAQLNQRFVTASWVGTTAPLVKVPSGSRARIIQVEESQVLRKRLADLGLAAGMDVRVLRQSQGHGPLIIAVRNDTRLALGWSIASKITAQIEG